ncbi:RDD family protein [Aeromicrobium tamlense]|uniref:RDD family membrane protein YckC n=1 Tax=Aeromicrobium tamlense TaxID=375541 RepID=A0A8I0KJ92_9ACTN|nr:MULTISPECIES: RDD family protein [Aeromicrobium]MBD1271715.1 RDD family protein [Aeromicrobium tamlense]NYI37537.1 putative RDD family membrane protein YckC [Aeromicrobium tamlense]
MTETFDDEPSLGRRLVALLIDWVIASLSAVAMFAWAGVTFPPEGIRDQLIINAVFIVEVAILVGLTGFSIGKRIMGLRLINPDGMPIGIPRALLRTLLLSVVIPAIVMTDDKRGLHDLAAGSKVVKA